MKNITTCVSGRFAHFFFHYLRIPMYRDMLLQSVTDFVEPLLQVQGFDLVELQLQQRKGRWLVRVFVDTEGGYHLKIVID